MGQAMASKTFDTRSGDDPVAPPPSPEEIAGKFPQFEVVECLGRGGMGVVYKARQKSLDRWVAIKVLAPERVHEERFAEHFEREAKTLAKMSHPNIVTVFDHGETDGLFYIVMEFIDGVNLRDLLREGKMIPEQALAIVPPVCEALEYAHDKGVVHRDIKPENLLLDREGRVKIADFGIASLVGVPGEKSGTPPYMAPEQEHGSVDRRADIYALGVVLYEMLTGERPAKDIVAPSRKVQVDVKIDEMVLRALEKEPERRYQTAGDFRTVVETLAESAGAKPEHSQVPPLDEGAVKQVRAPAIALIILGALNCLFLSGALIAFATRLVTAWRMETGTPVLAAGPVVLIAIVGACLSGFFLYAGMKMKRLERRGAGIAAGILLILISPGNFISLPIGIWILVVLNRDEVKAAFAARRNGLASPKHLENRPHFSRMAIFGAVWAFFILALVPVIFVSNAVPAGEAPPRPGIGTWFLLLMLLPGLTAPLGTTLLGWIAVSQIRRSAGKLYGMGLAVFDGLLFPLLALNGLIGAGVLLLVRLFLAETFRTEDISHGAEPDIGLVLLMTLVIGFVVDWLIVRSVWKTVNRPLAGLVPAANNKVDVDQLHSRGSGWWKRALGIVLLLLVAPVTLYLSLNRHSIGADIRVAQDRNFYATPFFDLDRFRELKPGMTEAQIRDALGYPLRYEVREYPGRSWEDNEVYWLYTAPPSADSPHYTSAELVTDSKTGKLYRTEIKEYHMKQNDRVPLRSPVTVNAGRISVSRGEETLRMRPESDEVYVILTGMRVDSADDLRDENLREREAFVTSTWKDLPRDNIHFVHMVSPDGDITWPELNGLLAELPTDSPIYSDYGMPIHAFENRGAPPENVVHDVVLYCKGTLYHYPEIYGPQDIERYYREDQNWLMHRLVSIAKGSPPEKVPSGSASKLSRGLGFGSVFERRVPFAGSCLNFKSGELRPISEMAIDTQEVRQAGGDLYVSSLQSDLNIVTAVDFRIRELGAGAWENISIKELGEVFEERGANHRMLTRRSESFLSPGVYAFRNHEITGILQVVGMTGPSDGEHDSVQIRYKLVESSSEDISGNKEQSTRERLNRQETSDAKALSFHGLEFASAPAQTDVSKLPDFWEARPPGSSSYKMREEVVCIHSGRDGAVFFIPSKNRFYIQKDPMGSSEHTFYGPFDGDPRKVLELPNDAQGAGTHDAAPFDASLSKGSVELVALSRYPSDDEMWWLPDGTPSKKNLFTTEASGGADPENFHWYSIVARLHGIPDDASEPVWRTGPRNSWAQGKVLTDRETKGGRLAMMATKQPRVARTMSVSIGVATGPWETIAEAEARAIPATPQATRYGQVAILPPHEDEDGLRLTATHTFRDRQLRLVAVENGGTEHFGVDFEQVKTDELGSTSVTFPQLSIRQRNVTFRFQVRAYEWRTFENVSLVPGQRTRVVTPVPEAKSSPPGAESRKADPAEASFRPVRERSLPDLSSKAGYEFLSLRSGKFLSLPKSKEEAEGEESAFHWISKQPVDLAARWMRAPEDREEILLSCMKTKLADFDDERWASATPAECAKALKSETTLRKWDAGSEGELLAGLGIQVYLLPPASQLPRTFAFETRDGTTGVMQITAYDDDPRAVRIRYKRVNPEQGDDDPK